MLHGIYRLREVAATGWCRCVTRALANMKLQSVRRPDRRLRRVGVPPTLNTEGVRTLSFVAPLSAYHTLAALLAAHFRRLLVAGTSRQARAPVINFRT